MKYKLVQRKNPQEPQAAKKWYAIPVNAGTLSLKELSAEISGRSSLTQGDVENVLRNLVEQLPVFLRIGMSVQLGAFGTFRLNLSSKGAAEPKLFDSNVNIRRTRLIFTPSKELKAALAATPLEQRVETPATPEVTEP